MKKRLRKKLHKGEFQEFGFNVDFDYYGTNEDDFLDSFIEDAIENNNLQSGGGGGGDDKHWGFYVVRYKGSVSEEQRNAVKNWLKNQPSISNIVLGELCDSWYG